MSVLALIYLNGSVQQCLNERAECDLNGAQSIVFLLSTVSSCGMLMYKVGLMEALAMRLKIRKALLKENETLMGSAATGEATADASPASAFQGNPPPPPPQSQQEPQQSAATASSPASGFVISRNIPALPAAALVDVQPVASSSRTLRGMCDGCLQNVWSDDEVRVQLRRCMRYIGSHASVPVCRGEFARATITTTRDASEGIAEAVALLSIQARQGSCMTVSTGTSRADEALSLVMLLTGRHTANAPWSA